jgi:hypothetical protein
VKYTFIPFFKDYLLLIVKNRIIVTIKVPTTIIGSKRLEKRGNSGMVD